MLQHNFVYVLSDENWRIDPCHCSKLMPSKLKSLEASFHGKERERAAFYNGKYSYVAGKTSPHTKAPSNAKCEGREALRMYEQMQENRVRPHISIFLAALKECSSSGEVYTGMRIHAAIIDSGNDTSIVVASAIVHMYLKCGNRLDAQAVFDRMPNHDTVSWNVLIFGYVDSGQCELALTLFAHMQEEGFSPNDRTYVAALKACAGCAAKEESKHVEGELMKVEMLKQGMAIHCQLKKSRHDSDIFVANTLVDMYAKCGSMSHAREVFDRRLHHSVVSWNAIISGYADNRDGELAMQIFVCMQDEGFAPNARTYVAALKACTACLGNEKCKEGEGMLLKVKYLEKVIAIHSQLAKELYESDIFVASSLVDTYAKCGNMPRAHHVFDRMPYRNIVSWSAMIFGYAENGQCILALQFFECMQDEGITPNVQTYVAAIKACANSATGQIDMNFGKTEILQKGKIIHSRLAEDGHESDMLVATALVDMYAKCGNVIDAYRVFDKMMCWDTVSWSAIIFGYAESGESNLALQLFERMQDEGFKSDAQSYIAALRACANSAAKQEGTDKYAKIERLRKGTAIHALLVEDGYELDLFVASALIDMYVKCQSMVQARQVFDRMPDHDVVSWGALLFGYTENEECELALQLFAYMQDIGINPSAQIYGAAVKACASLAAKEEEQGGTGKIDYLEKSMAIHSQLAKSKLELNIFMATTLISTYSKCGSMVHARLIFDRMVQQDLVPWNALIIGYAENGKSSLALDLFMHMQEEGFEPDARSYVAVLKACGNLMALEAGRKNHVQICNVGLQNDLVVATGLIGLYGKCGSMIDAQQVFDSLITRDLVVWSALLTGYAHQGDAKCVFDSFTKLMEEGFQPDAITFLALLTVCSHSGLVVKGREYFESMCLNHLIPPNIEHYSCMIDLLGRANCLDDVMTVMKCMPFECNGATWRTVLSACRKWRNVVVGRLAFESLLRLDDKDGSCYVLMANLYADSGMSEKSVKIEAMQRNG